MPASPARASHARVFTTAFLVVFLALTLAPTLLRIAETGSSAGFNGPMLTLLLAFGSLIGAAVGAGLVFRLGRWRLSAWDALRPRQSLLVGALAGGMSAALTDPSLQLALLNGLALVLRPLGLEPLPAGVVSHPGSGVTLMVKIGVSLLALAFGCGVAASVLVYFPSLAHVTRAARLGLLGEVVSG